MRRPQGKKANQNARRRVQQAEERSKKRQRSKEPGVHVCLPSRPPSPFPDLCYVVPSGEQPMGDHPADAASASPLGEELPE